MSEKWEQLPIQGESTILVKQDFILFIAEYFPFHHHQSWEQGRTLKIQRDSKLCVNFKNW